jgi:hypothetical protein
MRVDQVATQRDRVRQALDAAKLTPADIDARLHLSVGYFGKVLRGEREFGERHLAEIALLTGVSEDWLRTGEPRGTAEAAAAYDTGGDAVPTRDGEGKAVKDPEAPEKSQTVVLVVVGRCPECRSPLERSARRCPACLTALHWPTVEIEAPKKET